MKNIVLDTSVLSAFFNKGGAPKPVKDWLDSVIDDHLLVMSPITRLEIEFGLGRIKPNGYQLVQKFRQFVMDMEIREESVTGEIASTAADKKQAAEAQGKQYHNEDLLIGALAARYSHLIGPTYIATFNAKDFEHWGIPLMIP